MNTKKYIFPLLLLCLFCFHSCEEPLTPQTDATIDTSGFTTTVSSLTETTARLSCTVDLDETSYSSVQCGIFYSEVKDDVQNNQRVKRVVGSALSDGKFSVSLSKLHSGKVYYYRIWVCLNESQYLFGGVKSLTTKSSTENGYEYVDLGLSVMWATHNIGAASSEEAGDYFAWGETEIKSLYTEDNYDFDAMQADLPYSKDAARVIMGGRWRMPNPQEYVELVEHCSWEFQESKQTNGYKVTGPNGNSIFLPMAGYCQAESVEQYAVLGVYWSNTQADAASVYDDRFASHMLFTHDIKASQEYALAYTGLSVRPVFRHNQTCSVRYDANGGSGYMPEHTVSIGDSYVIEANAYTNGQYEFNGWNTQADGSGESYQSAEIYYLGEDLTLYAQWKRQSGGTCNGHAYVDLGLSVMWATCNVGAESPEDYGDLYVSWGETWAKSNYDWAHYAFGNDASALTKYCHLSSYGYNGFADNLMQLEAQDDAATQHMGEGWRTPTYEEMSELINNCTWKWTSKNGVEGYEIISNINGNSIFMPAAGYYQNDSYYKGGVNGSYWTATIYGSNPANAHCLSFHSGAVNQSRYYRTYGQSVRAVCDVQPEEEPGSDDFAGSYTANAIADNGSSVNYVVEIIQDATNPAVYWVENIHYASNIIGLHNSRLEARYDEANQTLRIYDTQMIASTTEYPYIFAETVIVSPADASLAFAGQDMLLSFNEKGEIVLPYGYIITAHNNAEATSLQGYFGYVYNIVLSK